MTFWHSLKQVDSSHVREAALSLAYNLGGSLAPVWFGFILLSLFSRLPTAADFTQHGEFALYSSAMFAPALYLVLKDVPTPGFPGRSVFGLLCVTGVITSTCFFAAVTTAFMYPTPVLQINQCFLQCGTLLLFVLSALTLFVITILDNARLPLDIRKSLASQITTLTKQFEELGGGQ
jgi:hypothetical protein